MASLVPFVFVSLCIEGREEGGWAQDYNMATPVVATA